MQLLLLRHAKSDWSTADPDHERPLSSRGRQDASRIGEWFAGHHKPPARVVCSTAVRARQTLERFNQAAGIPAGRIEFSPQLYQASLQHLLAVIGGHHALTSLMLVGHNPGLDNLLMHLCGAGLPRTESGKLMTTANLAVLEKFSPGHRKSDHSEAFRLVVLQRPHDA